MADSSRFQYHVTSQRFELLINSVTDYAIYMLDAEGHIATWNPGARRFKGYEAEEIIGRHFSNFFTAEDRARGLPAHILKTAATEGKFEAEGWRIRKDGTRFWAHVVVDPIKAPDGRLLGFAKITRDLTEKKAAQDALKLSEQKFRMLVQGVRDYALYMLDRDGFVSNWNTGAATIKGYTEDEIVGQHFSRFYTEEDRASGEPGRALETAIREGKYEKEAWRVRKDGTRFWASVVLDPIYDETGTLVGFAKITRDITERLKAQQELDQTRAALFQAQKLQALGELTGGIAHDFNNLMTVIRGSAELLKRGNLAQDRRERYLDAIVETAERAATLTSHLLAFGRRQPLKPEVIDLNLRLDAFGEVLARTLGSRIEVKLDLAPGLWLAEVDSAQLETALLNAAFNARDAMPEGGAITLATRNAADVPTMGEAVCVEVIDTGEGMDAETATRAFEPFFTTKPVGKGTGLGLSQIHGFAAQTGGKAEIDTTPGKGTTIRLLLPRATRGLAPPAEKGPAPEDRTDAHILVVEDNEHVLEFAAHLLRELGYRVATASCSDEALEMLESEHIDLLFSDVVMPGMSGVELARVAQKRIEGLPVLLASGYSEEMVGGGASEFDFIRKPYDPEMLRQAIASALAAASTASSASAPEGAQDGESA